MASEQQQAPPPVGAIKLDPLNKYLIQHAFNGPFKHQEEFEPEFDGKFSKLPAPHASPYDFYRYEFSQHKCSTSDADDAFKVEKRIYLDAEPFLSSLELPVDKALSVQFTYSCKIEKQINWPDDLENKILLEDKHEVLNLDFGVRKSWPTGWDEVHWELQKFLWKQHLKNDHQHRLMNEGIWYSCTGFEIRVSKLDFSYLLPEFQTPGTR